MSIFPIKGLCSLIWTVFYKLFAVMMSLFYSINGFTSPATTDPIKAVDEDNVKMTFAAWADPQISNYMLKREQYVRGGAEDLANAETPIDALVLAGDIAENGLYGEFQFVYDRIADTGVKNFITATGNHDIRLRAYSNSLKHFTTFTNALNENAGSDLRVDSMYYRYQVNGYDFVVLGSEKMVFEEAYISDTQLEWLDTTLKETSATGKPTFVILHQPLKGTNNIENAWNSSVEGAGSVGDQSDALYEIMNRYDNIILITGHLHQGFGVGTYDLVGKIHSVNLPSITIDNKDGDDAGNIPGIGYMVEVYEDEVLFRARNFAKGEYMPTYDISIDVL
ncbi:MAG: metallophosphoesterase [Clostridia bacterium]|nr:metallophosphoesterase [Clostridia bacterium]